MKSIADCHLYTFVDTDYLNGRPATELARQLCDGGADIVQLRAKGIPDTDLLRLAAAIEPITTRAGVHLVINDRVAVALSLPDPFVHLGQEDFFDSGFRHVHELVPPRPPHSAEPRAHPSLRLRIGLSSHSPAEAQRALDAGPDYIAIGPVFPSATKPGRLPATLDYVRWAARHVGIPWFAIGGITLDNLDLVLDAGATRVCVISAILNAPDVPRACQQFSERLRSARSNPNRS